MRYAWWVVPRKDFVMPETGYTVGWQGTRCHLVPSPEGHRALDILGSPDWAMGAVENVLRLPPIPGYVLNLGWYGIEEGGMACLRIFPFFLPFPWTGGQPRAPKAAQGRFEQSGDWPPPFERPRTVYDWLV